MVFIDQVGTMAPEETFIQQDVFKVGQIFRGQLPGAIWQIDIAVVAHPFDVCDLF